jgi:methionine sulfoxide reductase catalytic subunit
MLIKSMSSIPYSEVTSKSVYINRRRFLASAAVGAAVIATKPMMGWLEPQTVAASTKFENPVKSPYSTAETQTPSRIVTTFNNYWEFGDQKEDPYKNAVKFRTSPWSISVEGEVAKPRTFTMDEILQLAPLEERIYRHRCVEGWSIVVPWIGYSLNVLAKLVQPTSKARYVTFQSYYDVKQMPLATRSGLDFPYVEGLRLDEAMHPLALLCVGMYGETLPNQDGAPVRMVIPWKYGYKSIKSLVKVRFVGDQPPTTWNLANPGEYGFYSNVNPQVPNPRYSQATEQRLGGPLFGKRISTQMFNGYDQVAGLYAGMDLHKYY